MLDIFVDGSLRNEKSSNQSMAYGIVFEIKGKRILEYAKAVEEEELLKIKNIHNLELYSIYKALHLVNKNKISNSTIRVHSDSDAAMSAIREKKKYADFNNDIYSRYKSILGYVTKHLKNDVSMLCIKSAENHGRAHDLAYNASAGNERDMNIVKEALKELEEVKPAEVAPVECKVVDESDDIIALINKLQSEYIDLKVVHKDKKDTFDKLTKDTNELREELDSITKKLGDKKSEYETIASQVEGYESINNTYKVHISEREALEKEQLDMIQTLEYEIGELTNQMQVSRDRYKFEIEILKREVEYIINQVY